MTRRKGTHMSRSTADRLAGYQRRYRELAERIAELGFISSGSVLRVHNRCGTASCRCHGDPPQLHGPYWQFTVKVDGKTVTRRLSETEARLYQEWISNDRQLRKLIAQMRQVAAKATVLIAKVESAA
jgi:hypothetical protein